MDSNTYADPAVIQESQNVVMVKINVDNQPDVATRYSASSLPTIVWMDANGVERGRTVGAGDISSFLGLMQQYR